MMPSQSSSLCVLSAAKTVLITANPAAKCQAAFALGEGWNRGRYGLPASGATISVPVRPARPEKPELQDPNMMQRRRLGSKSGRAALLHAVAHIEFNAIDLAADMIARFGGSPALSQELRGEFIRDWARVCHDEARHFSMISERLGELGMSYGDLPAHDGLWQAAQATAGMLAARLVIAPMVLEARGLDVTPPMIAKLKDVGDLQSASILQIIYDDEIGHVAAGTRWFHHICERESLPKAQTFQKMVRTYFHGLLKPPFNRAARDLAGLPLDYYEPLALRNSPLQDVKC